MIADRPILFMLHALGGSRAAFDPMRSALGDAFEVIAIDLPGFGDRDTRAGTTVQEMSNVVADVIRSRAAARWLLVGHSMGGKIATVVASRAMQGEQGLFGLMGVVLLAGSPPSPEPMDEARRERMIGWVEQGSLDDMAACTFIDANVGAPLAPKEQAMAVADLKRCSPHAWRAWLERGSREDWSAEVGILPWPSLIIVGSEDGDLGEAGQRETNLQVYPRAEFVTLDGAGHLLPLERSEAVAGAIARFWRDIADRAPAVPAATAQLIGSERVTRRTRALLAQRALPDAVAARSGVLTSGQLATLRAIAARVVPQPEPGIDLAARLDACLAEGNSDGWRFADMPCDGEAYAAALDTLSGFEAIGRSAQDQCLDAIAAGAYMTENAALTPKQFRQWFEDVRNDLLRLWLSHPATAAHIGFHGFANGGDVLRPQGFDRLSSGDRDVWENAV
ncbi:alpha/beta fold hydrolase [Robbsia sp. Bb-Pol-6]|uniref:Alpha/beta fold hydrolase n=1 Tax=Robbsia betulipollinis TaxID=2981849 RepID=A0ABT3ZJB2_9BURK|nr:alpha/beta hydrolase [Robbsia betulipollinis]MCY0386629.1 alpha/beta fold hydrolase [Robbsia betulipollinis]